MCSPACYVAAVVLLERVAAEPDATLVLAPTNAHRLLLTAVVVSAKFYDDSFEKNSWYAKVGGLSTEELNALELCFLEELRWRVVVTQQEYQSMVGFLASCDGSICGLKPPCVALLGNASSEDFDAECFLDNVVAKRRRSKSEFGELAESMKSALMLLSKYWYVLQPALLETVVQLFRNSTRWWHAPSCAGPLEEFTSKAHGPGYILGGAANQKKGQNLLRGWLPLDVPE